ncbi:MAG: hypothetical protein ACI8WB_001352 [Phenylobacterium sp.]|jgi:hypothetical protein
MSNNTNKPIFLHGLWRTGSTYFWNKFKQSSTDLRCFFEPFHHSLHKSHEELCLDFQKASSRFDLKFVRNNYYAEYEAGANGVEGYDWHFTTDDYHITPPSPSKPIGRYIAGLCQQARDNQQRPLLQFNRGILRGDWLDKEFDASSIYIIRSPQDSLNSYNRLNGTRKLNYYMSCYLGIIGRNSKLPLFKEMAEYLNVGYYESGTFGCHLKHYAKALNRLPEQKRVEMFSFFWTLGICEATKYADGVLDTSLALERDQCAVALQFEYTIEHATGEKLDLSDLNIRSYSDGALETSATAKQIIANAVSLLNPDFDKLEQWDLSKQTQAQLYHNCGIATQHEVYDFSQRQPLEQAKKADLFKEVS